MAAEVAVSTEAAAAAAAAEVTDEMASYEPVKLPTVAGVEPPLVSSSQEVSTTAPGLLDGDHGGHPAAAQVMRGKPERAPGSYTSARRSKRLERVLGSGELGQHGGDRRTAVSWLLAMCSIELANCEGFSHSRLTPRLTRGGALNARRLQFTVAAWYDVDGCE
uniref:Uncharacterized protein n=1 Tax=Setaria italica TaxID=4555 RepID=K4AG19_SETIT